MNDLLTQEEVDALPDKTIVEIIWAGGNGPHRYEIRHWDDKTYALVAPGHPQYAQDCEDWESYGPRSGWQIDYVSNTGNQRQTWVRLPTAGPWPHRPLTWSSDGKTRCPECKGECAFADHEHNKQFVRPKLY